MTRPIDTHSVIPWYKQFWPWFVFSLPACVVVAGLATVVIANQHADDLVVSDYYKTGLAINRELEKRQAAQRLGISSNLQLTNTSVSLAITGDMSADTLTLRLSHPMEADQDFFVTLYGRSIPGRYEGMLPRSVGPHWHWVLESPKQNNWRLDGVLEAVNFTGQAI